jgi:hypothetical protein
LKTNTPEYEEWRSQYGRKQRYKPPPPLHNNRQFITSHALPTVRTILPGQQSFQFADTQNSQRKDMSR